MSIVQQGAALCEWDMHKYTAPFVRERVLFTERSIVSTQWNELDTFLNEAHPSITSSKCIHLGCILCKFIHLYCVNQLLNLNLFNGV